MIGNSQYDHYRLSAQFRCAAKRHANDVLGLALTSITLAVIAGSAGCDTAKPTGDPPMGAIVYVDLETHQPIVQLASQEVPAVHPETGRRTLMPGLYCPTCERWHPSPPFDTLQHTPGAATCPTDGTPLTTDGPWPQGDDQ